MFSIEQRGKLIDKAKSYGSAVNAAGITLEQGFNILRDLEQGSLSITDSRFLQNLLEIASFLRRSDPSIFVEEVMGAFFLLIDLDKSKLSLDESRFLASFYSCAVNSQRAGNELGIWAQLSQAELNELMQYQQASVLDIDDNDLITHSRELIKQLGNFSIGFISRFTRELSLLIETLECPTASSQDQLLARNGLVYVFENDDVIPDNIGVLGLIDDMCVVRATAGHLNPNLARISNDIEAMLSKSVFLKDLCFSFKVNKKESSMPLSDFVLQTFHPFHNVLSQNNVNASSKKLFIHTLGEASPIAIAMAWISAISTYALPCESKPERSNIHFKKEDKVAVDFSKASIFEGFDKIGDETTLKLRSERVQSGKVLKTWQHIPIKDAGRVLRAMDERSAKGFASSVMSDQNREINALASVFNKSSTPFISLMAPRIFLVTSFVEVERFETEYKLNGVELRRAIPTAKIRRDGLLESCTGAVDSSEARLVLASSIHHLVDFEYEGGTRDGDIVIVDLESQQSNISALVDLQDTPLNLFILGEVLAGEISEFFAKNDFNFMVWGKQSINSVLSSEVFLYNWEKNLKNRAELDISASHVECLEAEEYYLAFRSVMSEFKPDMELKELIDIRFEVLGFFFDSVSLTSVHDRMEEASANLSDHLVKIETLLGEARYVEGEILEKVRLLIDIWHRNGNKIIAAKTEELNKYFGVFEFVKPRSNLLTSRDFLSTNEYSKTSFNLLFPYWPTKRQLNETIRNKGLDKLKLVLFSFEYRWFESFLKFNEISKTVSDCLDPDYKHLFDAQEPSTTEDESSDFDAIQSRLRLERAKNKAFDYDSGPLAHPDRIFLCSDDVEIFATARSNFVVARQSNDNFDVSEIDGMGVRTGDFLIFVPHAESSAIKVLADKELEEGVRQKAKIWQTEVRAALDEKGINLAEFRNRLESKGLSRTATTISNWVKNDDIIAPRNYRDVLPLVFETLGLDLDIDTLITAIQEVYSAHMRAARDINSLLKENLSGNEFSDSDLDIFLVHEVQMVRDYALPYSQLSKPLRS